MDKHTEIIYLNLLKQLNSFWNTQNEESNILLKEKYFFRALERASICIQSTHSKYAQTGKLNSLNTTQYAIFLYYLSNLTGVGGNRVLADKIYYLNKIMHSVDWYWEIQLPNHFHAEHPLGSVLGRATYGDYLMVYQGTTVGGNFNGKGVKYPIFGKYIILYTNATILGNCKVGNKVVFSANCFVKDESIQDNCIVSGSSPNLVIRRLPEEKINNYFKSIWDIEE